MEELIGFLTASLKYIFWGSVIISNIGIIITILLENRNVSKAKAYILVLIFLPVIGIIVFYFFGRDYRKRVKLRFKNKSDIKSLSEFHQKLYKQQLCLIRAFPLS